ncbi:unnamed protein product [Lymnaea stagnalis]|uniref:Uncharacterized protein n=1 Tax=Lymnaea stagnalis TaxID=6523 RepID=A0AAV2IL55_LYMST
MIRAVTVHVTNEYNERELDRKMDLCLGHLDKRSQAVKELQDELSRCEERLGAGQVSEMLDSDHNIGHAAETRDNSAPNQTSRQSSDTSSPPLYKETYRPFERGWGSQLSEQPTTHIANSHHLSYSAKPHQSNSYSPTNTQQSHSYSPNNQQSNSYSPNPQQSHSYSPNPQRSHSYSPNPQQSHSYSPNNQQSNSYSPNPQQSHSYSPNPQQSHSYSPNNQQLNSYSPNPQQSNYYSPNPQQSNSYSPNPQQSNSYSPNPQQSNSYSPNPQQSNSYSPNPQQSNSYSPNNQQLNSYSPNPQQSNSNSAQTARRQVSKSYSRPPDSYSPSHEQTSSYSPKFQKTNYSSQLPTKVHSKNSASDTRTSVQKKSVTFSQAIEDSEFTEDLDILGDHDQRKENSVNSSNAMLRGSVGFKDDSGSHIYANIGPIFSERLTDPASLNRVTFSRDSRSERRNDEGKTLGGFKHRSRSAERSTVHSVDRPRAEMNRSENGGFNLTNHRVYNSLVVNHYGLELSDQRDFRRNNPQAQVSVPNCYRASQESYERTRNLKRADEGQTYSGGRLETPPLHSIHNSEGAQNAFQRFHAPTDESQIPSRDEHLFQFDKLDTRSITNKVSRSDNGPVHGAVPGMQLSSWREMRDTSGPAHNSGHLFDQGISDPRLNNDSGSPRFSMNEVAGRGLSRRGRAENSAENLLNSVQGYKQQTDMTKGIDSTGSTRSTEAHVLHRPTLSERGRLDVPGGTPYSNKQEVISTKQQTDIHNGQQTSEALAGRQKNEQTRASTAVTDTRAPHEIHRTNTHNRPSSVPNHGEHVGVHQDSSHVQFVHNALPSTANGVHGIPLFYGSDGPRAKAESKSFRNYDTAHSTAQNASHGESTHEGIFSFSSGGEQLSPIASPNKDINGGISNGGRGALYHIVSNKMNRIKNEQNSAREKTDRSESSSSEPPTWVTNGESMSTNVTEKRTTGGAKVSNGMSAISGPVPIRDKPSETFTHKSEPSAVNGSTSFTHHNHVTKNYGNHNVSGAVTQDWESISPKGSNPYFLAKTGHKTPGQIFEDHYQHPANSEYQPQTPVNGHLKTVQHCTLPDAKQVMTVNLNDIPIMYNKQSGKSSRDAKFIAGVAHRPLMTNGQGVVRTKLEDTNDSNSDTGLSSMHSDETANMETLV